MLTGSILGSGLGKPGGEVRWGVSGRMTVAWLITLPCAGAVDHLIVHGIGGFAGAATGLLLLVVAGAIWQWSRRSPVNHTNVNDGQPERRYFPGGHGPADGEPGNVLVAAH